MRYRYRTSTDTEDALPADGRWDAKARLRGDFIESQFEEHQVEQSVKNLLPEHVPGTMLEDLELSADLETTLATWDIPLGDRYLLKYRASCSDDNYLNIALDHVVSLKEG